MQDKQLRKMLEICDERKAKLTMSLVDLRHEKDPNGHGVCPDLFFDFLIEDSEGSHFTMVYGIGDEEPVGSSEAFTQCLADLLSDEKAKERLANRQPLVAIG